MNIVDVLIIEPNVTVRLVLSGIIRETENISISGTYSGSNIEKTYDLIRSKKPDVLLFGMDKKNSKELDLFLSIRSMFPALPIVVITPLDSLGADVALEALKKGAVDYITRPVNREGAVMARRHFKKRVLPLLKSVPGLNLDFMKPDVVNPDFENKVNGAAAYMKRSLGQVEIVTIGGSIGGVQALYPLLSGLPENLSVPLVIVQHMPKIYTEALAADLNRLIPLNVLEAKNGNTLLPGHVYIIPGGYHSIVGMSGYRKTINLHRGPREQKNRPSIDVMLRSVSHFYRDKALGVILSGSGMDGLHGAKMMSDAGGQIVTPDHKSVLLWDLPSKIINRGNCAGMYPLNRLGFEIISRIKPAKVVSAKKIKRRYEGLPDSFKNVDFSKA